LLQHGKSYSQAHYITESQFLRGVKEVALDFPGDPTLLHVAVAEQRSVIQSELAKYGITIRPNAPVRLRASVVSVNRTIIFKSVNGNQIDDTGTTPVHQIQLAMQFLLRVATRRNGTFHAITAAPAACTRLELVFERPPFQKSVLGDDTASEMKSKFKNSVAGCLEDIDAHRQGETKPWEVVGWNARDKTTADAEFTRMMNPQTPLDKGNFRGLNLEPEIVLTPVTNNTRCDPSLWRTSWNSVVQRAGLTQNQSQPTLSLYHYYLCWTPDGLTAIDYFSLFDQIRLVETNVVFELNGSVVRRGGSLVVRGNSQFVLAKDLDAELKHYMPDTLAKFLREVEYSRGLDRPAPAPVRRP
jgi:hypothetical protein